MRLNKNYIVLMTEIYTET